MNAEEKNRNNSHATVDRVPMMVLSQLHTTLISHQIGDVIKLITLIRNKPRQQRTHNGNGMIRKLW